MGISINKISARPHGQNNARARDTMEVGMFKESKIYFIGEVMAAAIFSFTAVASLPAQAMPT